MTRMDKGQRSPQENPANTGQKSGPGRRLARHGSDRLLKLVFTTTAVASISALALVALCYAAGARINTTRSIPVGLYWTSDAPLEKGAYVMFCPPPAGVFTLAKERGYITGGFCLGGYGYMMKRVLAVGGASVTVTAAGVLIDGRMLPNSKPLAADPAGRPLPRHRADHYILDGSEVLLMSDVSALSFDGRYFGPIDRAQVESVIRPVFTW